MKFLKIVIYAITYIVYPFSFLVPRTERKIAIGSFRGAFNDNAKYLFIYLSQNVAKHVSVAWISKSKSTVGEIRKRGLSAYWIFSPMGIWYALRSKYWFFNAYTSDIMWCLSGGACCINLWHGVGLKRIEFNITTGPLYRRYHKKDVLDAFMHPEVFKRPNYLLSSTPFQTAILSTAFRISQSQCLEMGYPRDEILLCSDELRTRHIDKYENETTHRLIAQMRKYSKVYIYMPTWRDSQRGLFAQNLDFDRLNSILAKKNALCIFKPHANVIIESNAENYSNLLFIDGGVDVYPILPYTDVLITDYSSVLYDYILMPHKNVILFLYDYQDYVKDREFMYPFDCNVVGKRVCSSDELYALMETEDFEIDEVKRVELVHKMWGNTMETSPSAKIKDYFLSEVGGK